MKPRTRIATLFAALLLPLAVAWADTAPARNDLAAGVTEANITRLTASLLARSQFSHRALDDQLAAAFLARYLEALDANHSLFLKSDIAEFNSNRASLVDATQRAGDTRLGHAIFARFLERLEQRTAFVKNALETTTFDFTTRSTFSLDREHAPRPTDMSEARELWRERLRFDYLQEKLGGKAPERIVEMLAHRAERSLRNMRQMSREAVHEVYLSALAQVYDPHSDYLGREQMEDFSIRMNLALFGIGARLRSDEGQCKIVDLLPGGGAERSGELGPGDVIVAVAQGDEEPVDVVDLSLRRIVALIRGPKGSVVRLIVLPASAGDEAKRKTVTIVRDEIKLEAHRAKARIIDHPDSTGAVHRIGVVDLPSFYADTGRKRAGRTQALVSATADVATLINKLKAEKVQGVILDLRRNGGGSLDEAISLTGLFITEGPVVQTRGPDGRIDVGNDSDPSVTYGGPLVVLTSAASASASEIVAGALQDYGRAVVVGDASTYGKGTVQSVVRLAPMMDRAGLAYSYDPGALTLTIRKFYRPSGGSTQLKGVIPDIILPSPTDRRDVGESVLKNALPWDTIAPDDFHRLGLVTPYVDALRQQSSLRIEAREDFAFLRAEVVRLARALETRTVSLNEAERRKEIADAEQRRSKLDEVLRQPDGPIPVIYALSVADAARPGLPDPAAAPEIGVSSEPAVGAASAHADPQANPGSKSDAKPPPRDIILHETQRILLDYLSLLDHGGTLQARRAVAQEVQTR